MNKPRSIQLFGGVYLDPLHPDPSSFNVRDIAHSLSLQCRFTGHCSRFYSVAQHSLIVAEQVPERFKLTALLHDASEYALCDLPTPLKQDTTLGNRYRAAEDLFMQQISQHYRTVWPLPREVKIADERALATEVRDLMPATGTDEDKLQWGEILTIEPLPETIIPLAPEVCEALFVHAFNTYGGQE